MVGYLAAIQTVLMELQDAVYEGLMGRVQLDQRQSLGLDGDVKTEVVFRQSLEISKGKSEITPP